MLWLEIVLLAVVQGIGEFLPISSSGHVVVAAGLFEQAGHPLQELLTVNIVLHAGTLLTILVFYWRQILRLLGEDRRVLGLVVAATLPAAAVGPLLKHYCTHFLEHALTAGLMLPVTGLLLLWAERQPPGTTTCRNVSYSKALLIGTFQAFAILPGLSRSGTTIAAGLRCGLRRDEAATFAFLMAIPAIGGAILLELLDLLARPPEAVSSGLLFTGAGISFVVGLASLWWLVRWLQRGRLHLFAWWVIPLGTIVVLWQGWRLWCGG